MTPATQLAVDLHNTTRWHFLHWINPVRAALDYGHQADWILEVGAVHGPSGLSAAIAGQSVVPV